MSECFDECEDCMCASCDYNARCDACVLCNHYQRYPTYGEDECPHDWEEERREEKVKMANSCKCIVIDIDDPEDPTKGIHLYKEEEKIEALTRQLFGKKKGDKNGTSCEA